MKENSLEYNFQLKKLMNFYYFLRDFKTAE